MSAQAYERKPMSLATGQAHTVKLPPRVMRGRLTGFLFETAKTFLLPSALRGIKALADFYAAHPGMKVLVTGHTDTVDTPDYNRGLSEERAASVAAYLVDDVDAWLARYQGSAYGKAWGTREDQHMLSALPAGAPPYYAGKVHGQLDAATQDAVRRFQTDHGLTVDGIPGPQTRRALVTDYMAIDGTSLPAGTEVQQHGCGEHHNAVPTPDETEEPANRRVEVFFFEGPIEPAPQRPCPSPGCAEYPEWLRRTILTIDHDLGDPLYSATVEVLDPAGKAVPGAEVLLQSAQAQRQPAGPDGIAHFGDLWAGRYSVVATHPGHEPGTGELVVGEPGGGDPDDDLALAAAPGAKAAAAKKVNATTIVLATRLLRIKYEQMFTIANKEVARMPRGPVEAGITVTVDELFTATTDAAGVATFDASLLGTGVHRAVANAASVDKRYEGVTGPLVLPRPAPKDDVLYRDMDIEFTLDATFSVAATPPPELFSLPTDGGVWRKGPLDILVDWKPVWIRAVRHKPRPGDPHPNDVPNILVLHRTAGATIGSSANLITGPPPDETSVHYVIDVDGYVLKLVREDEVSNHAGGSFWRGQVGVNATSIGIEIVNVGPGHDYPPPQLKALRDLMWSIRRSSNIPLQNVVGHSDVEVNNTNPAKPIDLRPSHQRPHDPGLELDWIGLATRIPAMGALGDPVALAADPTTVTAAEQDAMYGGYFAKFTQPWANGDNDAGRQWGSRIRKADDLTSADPIAELQRDFQTIGYSIAQTTAQVPDGRFDDRLARLCQRFHHRWFGSPVNKPWKGFRDNLTFTRDTAVMVKAVLKAL